VLNATFSNISVISLRPVLVVEEAGIMCVLAPGLFVKIIDSRVKIIDNERPGASPCDSRGRLQANNTKSILIFGA
jgi:hypothetical protein